MRRVLFLVFPVVVLACGGASSSSSAAAASACFSDEDCPGDLVCRTPERSWREKIPCGTCEVGLAAGVDCGRRLFAHEGPSCARGLRCVPDTVSPNGAACQPIRKLAEGESCDCMRQDCACGEGLACGGPAKTCVRVPATPRSVPKDGLCVGNTLTEKECAPPYRCVKGVCTEGVAIGNPCGTLTPCAPGLVCGRGDLCAEPVPNGSPCAPNVDECASHACAIEDEWSGKGFCTDAAGKGEACGGLRPCGPDLGCSDEHVCVGIAKRGEPCDALTRCASDEDTCVDGVCTSRLRTECGR